MKQSLPIPAKKARRRRRRRWIALGICLLLVVPAISYVRALTYPGNAPFSVRSVEWIRDHGGGKIIDTIETWKYSRQAPPATGGPKEIPASGTAGTAGAAGAVAPKPGQVVSLPKINLLPGVKPLPHEGVWSAARTGAKGKSLLYTGWVRPDPGHLPVTAAAALMPQANDKIRLMPGTREPVVGMASKSGYSVPSSALSGLVAVFNAGFKMHDSKSGWYTSESGAAVPLVDGRASAVIDKTGTVQIGAWNQTVRMTPDVVAVRQNLDMVIVNGKIANGLADNATGAWGSTRSQFQYTSRSGLGTDANGNLIYVAGDGLTLATLASAMHQAGIVNGMELDIHSAMVSFNIEQPVSGNLSVNSRKLLPSMSSPVDRYLSADQRDFFYVVAR
jgi:hypothetical protein